MSEQAAPQAGSPAASQGRLSGHLLISLGLSIASVILLGRQIGILLFGVGPIIAGFLAFVGRKKALADPAIIGPRFALGCMAVAVLALGFQIFALVKTLPIAALNKEIYTKQTTLLEHLRDRKYDELYQLMDPSFRESRSVQALKADLQKVFPGEQPIELDLDGAKVREEDADEQDFLRRRNALLSNEAAELEFVWPYRFEMSDGPVAIDIRMRAERTGYDDFVARILDFSARRLEESADEKSADPPAKDDSEK